MGHHHNVQIFQYYSTMKKLSWNPSFVLDGLGIDWGGFTI